MPGHLAIVLHAHLPWVRHPEHATPLEERWLHEALWESYLPLCDLLDRLAKDGVRAGFTISVSPTLAAMLGDELLRRRFEQHMERLAQLALRLEASASVALELRPALAFHRERIEAARESFRRNGRDVLGALVRHHRAGHIELATTAATHAYLPGLVDETSVSAQIGLGRQAFEAISGVRPAGLWLPECAFEERVDKALARAGVAYSVLDAHGLTLARPRPQRPLRAPVLSPSGVVFFARDPDASFDVWSRRGGYPGDPVYRDFYRDLGFDLPARELGDELGPNGTRVMTGLKPYRITGPDLDKAPYDPAVALERAREHARHFVTKRADTAEGDVIVAPFDAELFGHWWFEGPVFLEEVARELGRSAARGGVAKATLGDELRKGRELVVAEPAASSWGEGGFGGVWTGREAAWLLRHLHHAERAVRSAVASAPEIDHDGVGGVALDQAIRELLLLEASDWAFMIHGKTTAEYALARVGTHAHRANWLAAVARGREAESREAEVRALAASTPFLTQLSSDTLRSAFRD